MKVVRTRRYLKDMKRIGASAADMMAVEQAIASNPAAGDVIQGLGGIRKIRFRLGSRGKSGGGRAIYFLMISEEWPCCSQPTPRTRKPIFRAPIARLCSP